MLFLYNYEFRYSQLYKRDKRDHQDMLKKVIMMCVRMRRLPYLTVSQHSRNTIHRRRI